MVLWRSNGPWHHWIMLSTLIFPQNILVSLRVGRGFTDISAQFISVTGAGPLLLPETSCHCRATIFHPPGEWLGDKAIVFDTSDIATSISFLNFFHAWRTLYNRDHFNNWCNITFVNNGTFGDIPTQSPATITTENKDLNWISIGI